MEGGVKDGLAGEEYSQIWELVKTAREKHGLYKTATQAVT
jgi:hypothetical protein